MPSLFRPASAAWHWTTLIGPDAADFLHRVTSANVRAMTVGKGSKGCFLTAQGKVRAVFTVWRYGEGEFGFEYDGGQSDRWKTALFETIDQLTFAEKMLLADVTALECRWLFFDAGETLPTQLHAFESLAIDDEIRVCHHGEKDFGKVWISVWGRPARLMQWLDHTYPSAEILSREKIETLRIEAAQPWIDREISSDTNPLEAGMADTIAPNKGCYPGQEVIEKIISLGSPPRRLAQLKGAGAPPSSGEKILNDTGAELGTLTSVASDAGGFTALGVIKKIHAKEGLAVKFERSPATASIVRIAPYE